jgi:hypothetical protein
MAIFYLQMDIFVRHPTSTKMGHISGTDIIILHRLCQLNPVAAKTPWNISIPLVMEALSRTLADSEELHPSVTKMIVVAISHIRIAAVVQSGDTWVYLMLKEISCLFSSSYKALVKGCGTTPDKSRMGLLHFKAVVGIHMPHFLHLTILRAAAASLRRSKATAGTDLEEALAVLAAACPQLEQTIDD